jgi:hypothetical protein
MASPMRVFGGRHVSLTKEKLQPSGKLIYVVEARRGGKVEILRMWRWWKKYMWLESWSHGFANAGRIKCHQPWRRMNSTTLFQ